MFTDNRGRQLPLGTNGDSTINFFIPLAQFRYISLGDKEYVIGRDNILILFHPHVNIFPEISLS